MEKVEEINVQTFGQRLWKPGCILKILEWNTCLAAISIEYFLGSRYKYDVTDKLILTDTIGLGYIYYFIICLVFSVMHVSDKKNKIFEVALLTVGAAFNTASGLKMLEWNDNWHRDFFDVYEETPSGVTYGLIFGLLSLICGLLMFVDALREVMQNPKQQCDEQTIQK